MSDIFTLFFRLRRVVALLITGLALAVGFLANRADLPWIAAICLLEMVVNQPYFLTRRWKDRPEFQARIHLLGDALLYTALIHFFGGISSGLFGACYFFIIFSAAVTMRPRVASLIGIFCFSCFLGLFLLEEFQVLARQNLINIELPLSLKIITLLLVAALSVGVGVIGVSFARLFRRQARQVSESEARYRGIFESSSDGIYILDLEGRAVAVNQTLLDWAGLRLDQVKGRSFLQFLKEESVDDAAALYQNVLQGERVAARDLTVTLASGRQLVLEISVAPMIVNQKMVGMVGVARDVTERQQMEARLERYAEDLEERTAERTLQLLDAKTRYQGLFENAAVPLAWLDREGKFYSVNQEMAELLGLDPGRLMTCRLLDLLALPEDQVRVAECLTGLCSAEDSAGPLEVALRRSDGPILTAELYIHLDPNQTHVLLSAIDITRRKEIEREQQTLHSQLIQAEKMALVGQLAAGVAHEVNNPLTAISYYAQTLSRACEKGGVPADAHEKLRKIEEGAERIQQLLAKLLAYARPQAEERQRVNLNQVVDQALDFTEHERERRPRLAIKKEFWPELAPILADPNQIHQVVVNLLMNAFEAIGENPGEICLTTRPTAAGVELVCVDNGEGILPRDLPRIFTPFFTTRAAGRGTGLGLAIVKRIVEDHGGKIRVESRHGRGATFFVHLPGAEP